MTSRIPSPGRSSVSQTHSRRHDLLTARRSSSWARAPSARAARWRELAGHTDIRTTTIYTAVNPSRLEHAIAERGRQNRGARRAAAGA